MESFTVIGVPIDSVGRDGGAELGPVALRELGLLEALDARDEGDLALRIRGEQRDPATGILASGDVLAATTAIRARIAKMVSLRRRPFLAGGCCAALPGALAGARDVLGPIALVHVDGHADLYDGETSTTGEAADMPASVALGLGPEAWVQAAGGASVAPQHLALVGYRDREESIADGMRQPETLSPAPILRPLDLLRSAGPGFAAAELSGRLGRAVPLWLHLDVDVLDPDAFPATDYLMPDGASWDELAEVLAPLLTSPALIGASLGCYNPEKDPGGASGRKLVEVLGAAARPDSPSPRVRASPDS